MLSEIMTGENPSPAAPSWVKIMVIGRNPKFTLARVIVLIVLSFVVFKFVFLPLRVTGVSMSPSYQDGRINFVNKLAYVRSKPQRGDVVAIRMAGEHVMLLKRIIGLPGERATVRRGRVFINDNDRPLEEYYLAYQPHRSWNNKEWRMSDDEYLVIGDNRSMPFASHYCGLAFEYQIAGKALF
ncbi:MAG: signal peptidase I [Pedosphaera sp.]|nr:signal peptidase I [Pedosphaera sp.]